MVSQLRHSALAVRSQHSRSSGRRRVPVRTRLLRDHHWLPVKQNIEYNLCMTVHRCLYGEAPRSTSSRRLPRRPPEQASDATLGALSQCHVPRHHSVTARSLWLSRVLGTICQSPLCWVLSVDTFRRHFSLLRLFKSFLALYFNRTYRRRCCAIAHLTSPYNLDFFD